MAYKQLLNVTANTVGSSVLIEATGNSRGVLQVSFIGAAPVGSVQLLGSIGDGHPMAPLGAPITGSYIGEIVPVPNMSATLTGIGVPATQIIVGVWE